MQFVKSKGKIFLAHRFQEKQLIELEKFGVPLYKIGSGECNNYPFSRIYSKQEKTYNFKHLE